MPRSYLGHEHFKSPSKWGAITWFYLQYLAAAFTCDRAKQFGAAILSTSAALPCLSCSGSIWKCLFYTTLRHASEYRKMGHAVDLLDFIRTAHLSKGGIPCRALTYFESFENNREAMRYIYLMHRSVMKKTDDIKHYTFKDMLHLFQEIGKQPCRVRFKRKHRKRPDAKLSAGEKNAGISIYSINCEFD